MWVIVTCKGSTKSLRYNLLTIFHSQIDSVVGRQTSDQRSLHCGEFNMFFDTVIGVPSVLHILTRIFGTVTLPSNLTSKV